MERRAGCAVFASGLHFSERVKRDLSLQTSAGASVPGMCSHCHLACWPAPDSHIGVSCRWLGEQDGETKWPFIPCYSQVFSQSHPNV